MTENWTVALAGNGDVTFENAKALLDDWLPVEGVGLVFPKLPRNAKTLRAIAKWAEEEEITVMPDITDLIESLIRAHKEGDQVYLVLAWDETEASSKLLEQALAADIQVKDLTRALDDLEFEDEDVPAESAGEPESPSGRTSEQRADNNDALAEQAGEDGSGDTNSTVLHDVESTGADTPVLSIASGVVQATAIGPATIAPQGRTYTPIVQATGEVTPFAVYLEEWVRTLVREEIALALAPPEKKNVPVLVDEDGNYRLGGKGRPRKGETATVLTPSEAKAVGIELEE